MCPQIPKKTLTPRNLLSTVQDTVQAKPGTEKKRPSEKNRRPVAEKRKLGAHSIITRMLSQDNKTKKEMILEGDNS